MVRVLSLVWTLLLALAVTAVSFFYTSGVSLHGFPFSFAKEAVNTNGETGFNINYWSALFDVLVWWFLFSVFWIIVRNYILQVD